MDFIEPYSWHIQLGKTAIDVIISFPFQYPETVTLSNVAETFFTILSQMGISKEILSEEQI